MQHQHKREVQKSYKIREKNGDFPGGPVVETLSRHDRGYGFDPRSENLRSHMPCGTAQRKKKNKEKNEETVKLLQQ